jgi:hypothetical protein
MENLWNDELLFRRRNVPRRIFECKRENAICGWRELHN